MFSTLRTRFGIPGVISVMALVFAMFGGAYAASNSSGGGKATASAKAKKGPRGPKGATGPAGPAGPQGLAGPAGANGKDGVNGTNGATGADGKSVALATLNPGQGGCLEGGTSVEVVGTGTKKSVCNGIEGSQGNAGPQGEPWTAGGTLPQGATETGTWAMQAQYTDTFIYEPIAFSVPLAAPLDEAHAVWAFQDEVHCTGSNVEPLAASGYLCVYGGGGSFAPPVSAPSVLKPNIFLSLGGAAVSGAVLKFEIEGAAAQTEGAEIKGAGAFAVTG